MAKKDSRNKGNQNNQPRKETNMQDQQTEQVQDVNSAINQQGTAATDQVPSITTDVAAATVSEQAANVAQGDALANGKTPLKGEDTGAVHEQETPAAAPAEETAAPQAVTQVAPPVVSDPYQLSLGCSPAAHLTIAELKHYIEQMSARFRMANEEGGRVQSGLYHTLMQLLKTRAEDFDEVFTLALRIIKDNQTGVFSDANVHRYTPYVTMPSNKIAHMRHLINAMTALADPAIRKEAKRVTNTELAFPVQHLKEEERQRVLGHFGF
jgi:hypothetical protein